MGRLSPISNPAVVQGGVTGTLLKGTVPLPGGETAIYNSAGMEFIRHKNYLGSSVLATTWAHAVYSKESYAPFGETYNEAGTPDRSFTGQDQDTVTGSGGTGIYDYLFRKYDPSAGRWISPDPSGWAVVSKADPQSLNRYAYVENQPMSAIDPNGLACVTSQDGVISIDNQGPIGEACTGNGGIYVPGDLEASDLTDLLAGGLSFYISNPDGGPDAYFGSGDYADMVAAGESSSTLNMTLSSMQAALSGSTLDSVVAAMTNSAADQWPFNGNLWPAAPQSQDGVCSTGPLLGPLMNSNLDIKACCAAHDACYSANNCRATSWLPILPGACTTCNAVVAMCILGAL